MKASSVRFNRNESAELHRTIDELRIEIRRREADFSERIDAMHADLRTRTEERDAARVEVAEMSEAAQNWCNRTRDVTAVVGEWKAMARTLATLVALGKTEGARDVAEIIRAVSEKA